MCWFLTPGDSACVAVCVHTRPATPNPTPRKCELPPRSRPCPILSPRGEGAVCGAERSTSHPAQLRTGALSAPVLGRYRLALRGSPSPWVQRLRPRTAAPPELRDDRGRGGRGGSVIFQVPCLLFHHVPVPGWVRGRLTRVEGRRWSGWRASYPRASARRQRTVPRRPWSRGSRCTGRRHRRPPGRSKASRPCRSWRKGPGRSGSPTRRTATTRHRRSCSRSTCPSSGGSSRPPRASRSCRSTSP